MPGSLAIFPLRAAASRASARELAFRSRFWDHTLDQTKTKTDATLLVAAPDPASEELIVLGQFQRASEVTNRVHTASTSTNTTRRGSGGGAARVGHGRIWMQLALRRVDALVVPCTADKLVNRYVRPLLQALTRMTSVSASYFGRDWISVMHQPVALVAFAHDGSTGRALFEAIIGVSETFSIGDRPSFLGKSPATLEDVAGRSIDLGKVQDAIVSAYEDMAAATKGELPPEEDEEDGEVDPPDSQRLHAGVSWTSTRQEAIGTIAAGRDASGRMRVGGELMASRDAITRLEGLVAQLSPNATSDDVGRVVDEALTSHGAITFGVRSLATIRDVIFEALQTAPNAQST